MISSRETSSSALPVSVIGSKSLGIGNKRIRRPGTGHFNPALSLPPLNEILQHAFPLFAARALHQKRSLPQQARLRAAYFSRGRGIGRHLLQCLRQFAQISIAVLGFLFHSRSFLL